MWIEYSCLITFFCAGAFLDPIVKGVSPRLPPPSPFPPNSPSPTPSPFLPLQSQLYIGGKESFNAIFKYQGNYTAVLVIFPLCNGIILFQHGHYLISARISYFSTKYEKKIWTLGQLIDLFSIKIFLFTNHYIHIKRSVRKKTMNLFVQVGIFTKTLKFLNAKVKAILYQHFTLW